MAYLGRQLTRGENRQIDDIASGFNGSTTAFNLTVAGNPAAPSTAQQLFIALNGALKKAGTDFTVSGSQITFTSAPANGVTFMGLLQGDSVSFQEPSDGTVTSSKIASGNFTFPSTSTSSLTLLAASDGNTTLTAAQSVNSLVTMTPSAQNNVTTATAAQIVTQLGTGAAVGTSFNITLRNQAASTHPMTLVAGTGVTLDSDNTNTVAATKTRVFVGRVTNAGSGSEAITIYSMGEGIH